MYLLAMYYKCGSSLTWMALADVGTTFLWNRHTQRASIQKIVSTVVANLNPGVHVCPPCIKPARLYNVAHIKALEAPYIYKPCDHGSLNTINHQQSNMTKHKSLIINCLSDLYYYYRLSNDHNSVRLYEQRLIAEHATFNEVL